MTPRRVIYLAKRYKPQMFATGRQPSAKGYTMTTWPVAVRFRHALIRRVAAMGMTVPDIAAELGLHKTTVGRILKGADGE